jgi:sugar (pentulose or hexulose) kinase
MRCLLYSTLGSLKIGMDILTEQEKVRLDGLLGHGGLFKTKSICQRFFAAALNTPISVMNSAGEGGAWGIALLAAYMRSGGGVSGEVSLEDFLSQQVFADSPVQKMDPNPDDAEGFREYMARYITGLQIEQAAVKYLEA